MRPARAQRRLELGRRRPPSAVAVSERSSTRTSRSSAAEVERDHAGEAAAQRLDAADHARAAAERDDRDAARRRRPRAPRAPRRALRGRTTASGAPFGVARAQAHEVGVALAGRVQHARRAVVAHSAAARRRSQQCLGAARSPAARRPRARPAPAASPPIAELGRAATSAPCVGQAPAWASSPQPHQRIVALSQVATLQPVERLVEDRARVARRTMKPPSARQSAHPLAQRRASRCVPVAGRLEPISAPRRRARARTACLELLLQAQHAGGGAGSATRKSARTARRPWPRSDLGERARARTPSTRSTRGHQRGRWCGSPTVSPDLRRAGRSGDGCRRVVGITSPS